MKIPFDSALLPSNAVLLTCSSHEERCLALSHRLDGWHPQRTLLFHYDEPNERREKHHTYLADSLGKISPLTVMEFTERDAAESIRRHCAVLREAVLSQSDRPIILDCSVLTKRHLFILLHWLDDVGAWERLWVLYSEPEEYDVSRFVPLSFGLLRVDDVPGFSASPDPSRPLHVAIFVGYEGDRALATYDHLEPGKTNLVIPDPPSRPHWKGRTESFNCDLISIIGAKELQYSDALDPDSTVSTLTNIFGPTESRAECSRSICPLGTKPQAIGIYRYVRSAIDPPAVIYAAPLRHNHGFYSHGRGPTWIVQAPI